MICVSVQDQNLEKIVQYVTTHRLVEIRLDLCNKELRTAEVLRTIAEKKLGTLIATCHPAHHLSVQDSFAVLSDALAAGFDYIDIDINYPADLRIALFQQAQMLGKKIIISFHNYAETPLREDLLQIIQHAHHLGASIVKIACMVNTPADAARLLGILDTNSPSLVVVGMGTLGRLVRIMSPLLGGVFTYASSEHDKETALGQLDYVTTLRYLADLKALGSSVSANSAVSGAEVLQDVLLRG